MHLFTDALVWEIEELHYISYTNFIFEVIGINFWQIWHFDVKDTGWVRLPLSIILLQTVRRFDMWMAPNAIFKVLFTFERHFAIKHCMLISAIW